MKTFVPLSVAIMFMCSTLTGSAQSNPRASSKSAAQYDAASIDENIADNKSVMYFAQLAIDRGSNAVTKEVARDMLADFTGLLYSMEQLAAAGGSGDKGVSANSSLQEARNLNETLSAVRGFNFDTAWLGGMLRMHQSKTTVLNDQKTNATNERLKTAVSEAIPVLKRYVTRMNNLQKQLIKRDQQEKREAARREQQEAAKQKKNQKK